ncbi:S-layer homology domain-containing protein [Paenibacillus sp. GCM10023252]|uniref:S-layer homology domain-containing protein n=1 Tax=Paenibacillus sp. GCM10023252 TaxID=3252649 RepID=UPI00361C04E3
MKITRAVFVLLMIAVLILPTAISHANDSPYQKERETLEALGLFQGTSKGPELSKTMTRAQAAVVLLRMSGDLTSMASEVGAASLFTDLSSTHWAYPYVMHATNKGYIKGTSTTQFSPEQSVTGKQFITMMLRSLGYVDAQPQSAAKLAVQAGMLSTDAAARLTSADPFVRGSMVEVMYAMLTTKLKGEEQTVLNRLVAKGQVTKEAALATGLLVEEGNPQPTPAPEKPVEPETPKDPMDAIEQAIHDKLHGH